MHQLVVQVMATSLPLPGPALWMDLAQLVKVRMHRMNNLFSLAFLAASPY
jgi:hypothetical protein